MLRFLFSMTLTVLLLMQIGCKSDKNENGGSSSKAKTIVEVPKGIDGTYNKLAGAGGVFENAKLIIKKMPEGYSIETFDSKGKSELKYTATSFYKNLLSWDDKGFAMQIEFKGNRATLKVVGGAMGEFEFEKE